MRITINLNPDILSRVDAEAKRLGTSRGAMLTTWIGEKIHNLEQARLWMEKLQDEKTIRQLMEVSAKLEKENREIMPSLFDDADDLGGGAG